MDGTRHLSYLLVLALTQVAFSQDIPLHPKPGAVICVATVTNMSVHSALVDRLTERLSNDLREEKIKALANAPTHHWSTELSGLVAPGRAQRKFPTSPSRCVLNHNARVPDSP